MDLNLKGKTAIVTGGSRGIGKAIKEALEKEGVNVISWSRTSGVDLESGWLSFNDVINLEQADILINNFGGGGTWKKEDSGKVMWKNYGVTKELTDIFLDNGRKKGGRVITIASVYGKEAGPNPYFTAAKSAQIGYIKSMANKYTGTKVTFNTICPGMIDTGKFTKTQMDGHSIGQPEDVADIVVFLCSNKARHINGSCIVIDGGESSSF